MHQHKQGEIPGANPVMDSSALFSPSSQLANKQLLYEREDNRHQGNTIGGEREGDKMEWKSKPLPLLDVSGKQQ